MHRLNTITNTEVATGFRVQTYPFSIQLQALVSLYEKACSVKNRTLLFSILFRKPICYLDELSIENFDIYMYTRMAISTTNCSSTNNNPTF